MDLFLSWWQQHLRDKLHLFTAHYKPLLRSPEQGNSLDLGACLTAAGCNLDSRSHFSSAKKVTGTEGLFQGPPCPSFQAQPGSQTPS